jgi:hypothetical protein
MNFAEVEKIAAAILYEGYILYPYRPTSIKNRQRWNFGTLYPRAYAEAQRPQEPFQFTAECLLEFCADDATLELKIQCLQLIRQQSNSRATADSLRAISDPSLEWEEAIERFAALTLSLEGLTDAPLVQSSRLTLADDANDPILEPLHAKLMIHATRLPNGICKVHLQLQNCNPLSGGSKATREEALPISLVSAHALLRVNGAKFVSLIEPPEIYREVVADCRNAGVFPVLAGNEPDRTMMLCSPIILYDYPKVAPESDGDFFDGTEMDEMLTLRVLTLTDAEKDEMRNCDPRASRILDRAESFTAESLMRAHGVIRSMRDIRGGQP